MIWSKNEKVNPYAKELFTASFKYFDIIANVAKYYCYSPSPANKADMQKGIGAEFAEMKRPELCKHYDIAKRMWKGELDFCTECDDPKCAINRYESQRKS